MFRILLAIALTTAGLFSGSMATAGTSPQSQPPIMEAGHHSHFDVYYRTCDHDPWRFYGSYDCLHDAQHAAGRVSRQGFLVSIRSH